MRRCACAAGFPPTKALTRPSHLAAPADTDSKDDSNEAVEPDKSDDEIRQVCQLSQLRSSGAGELSSGELL